MKLREFVERFVCCNTIIRLWTTCKNGHGYEMICEGEKEVGMEWQILNGKSFQSKYADREVVGVTDIICETDREAVNIVIK